MSRQVRLTSVMQLKDCMVALNAKNQQKSKRGDAINFSEQEKDKDKVKIKML